MVGKPPDVTPTCVIGSEYHGDGVESVERTSCFEAREPRAMKLSRGDGFKRD
jgi:hypothetical protein